MNELNAIGAVGMASTAPVIDRLGIDLRAPVATPTPNPAGASFASILEAGLAQVNEKIATADNLVRQFALDDNVPLHQVTLALEEARLSVELAMQVRQRLVDGYRELMNMQL